MMNSLFLNYSLRISSPHPRHDGVMYLFQGNQHIIANTYSFPHYHNIRVWLSSWKKNGYVI
jgi:hypothetical protein